MNRPAFGCTSRYHRRMGIAGRMGLIVARIVGLPVVTVMSAALVCGSAPAAAQPSNKVDKSEKKPSAKPSLAPVAPGASGTAAKPNAGNTGKPKVFDFTGLDIAGRLRTPQLMYFLERANEELERASLEKRSFVPSMVRSIDDEAL